MKYLQFHIRRLTPHFCLVAVLAVAYFAVQACDDPAPATEICNNEIDDDGDDKIDCDDENCIFDSACFNTDGDADSDSDSDGDSDTDSDTDSDSDSDAPDTDSDGCDPEVTICTYTCERDEDCALVFDMMECCGGYPHEVEGSVGEFACPSAAHVDKVRDYNCVIPWSSGDPLPEVPTNCDPYCTGVRCEACPPEPVRAACDESDGTCHALAEGGCIDDEDCGTGLICIDEDEDGRKECAVASHECTLSQDCLDMYDCKSCDCLDIGPGGTRVCSCTECKGDICFMDDDCETPHYFCEDHSCTFMGDDACHVGGSLDECTACEWCEPDDPSDGSSRRGTCRELADGGVEEDGGCSYP